MIIKVTSVATSFPRILASGGWLGMNAAQLLGRPVVFLDTETTGLDPRVDDIIELALMRVEATGGRYEYSAILRPDQPVSAEITEITGITADRAAKGGKPEKSLLHMWDLLADDPILVGHNAQFDLAMVAWNSIRRGIEVRFPSEFVCTRFMANAIFSQGHKLQNLIDRFGWQVEQTHRAVEDLWWTEKVLIEMYPTVARMGIRWKNSAVYLGGVANDDYGLTGINWQPWGFKPKE